MITPQGKLQDAKATYVSLPAHDGLMGVLPDRAAMVVKLGIGELHLAFEGEKGAPGGDRSYVVEDGFAQMVSNRLTVLASRATPAESIAIGDAEAALAEANARRATSGEDMAKVQRDRQRAQTLVRVARARSGKGI